MAERKKLDIKEIAVPALSLFVICLVVAGALAFVNSITEGPIAANNASGADAVRLELFPKARFEDLGGYASAYDRNGALLGYCMETEAQGYGGALRVMTALDTDGAVREVRVLSAENETPGLGQKVTEAGFLTQFVGGRDKVQVDSIASATISSQGVAEAVNMALDIFEEQIKGGEAQ